MKAYVGVDVQIHIFLISVLAGGEQSVSRPGRFTPGERAAGTRLIGGCVNLRAGLDMEKWIFLPPPRLELWPFGRPASRYTDYAIPAPKGKGVKTLFSKRPGASFEENGRKNICIWRDYYYQIKLSIVINKWMF
jgi:hypothetical protein